MRAAAPHKGKYAGPIADVLEELIEFYSRSAEASKIPRANLVHHVRKASNLESVHHLRPLFMNARPSPAVLSPSAVR